MSYLNIPYVQVTFLGFTRTIDQIVWGCDRPLWGFFQVDKDQVAWKFEYQHNKIVLPFLLLCKLLLKNPLFNIMLTSLL